MGDYVSVLVVLHSWLKIISSQSSLSKAYIYNEEITIRGREKAEKQVYWRYMSRHSLSKCNFRRNAVGSSVMFCIAANCSWVHWYTIHSAYKICMVYKACSYFFSKMLAVSFKCSWFKHLWSGRFDWPACGSIHCAMTSRNFPSATLESSPPFSGSWMKKLSLGLGLQNGDHKTFQSQFFVICTITKKK